MSADLASRLATALRLDAPPIAITFSTEPASPAGSVAAGCVFWMKATGRTFATTASDHANCNVGSYTHGWIDLATAARGDDVKAVLAAGWVDEAAMQRLPHVTERPRSITYGPLAECRSTPDVVLVRVDGRGLMTLHGALPDLAIEGRPQCHVVALAKERSAVAASVGCALSRARTGMPPAEMTCAIPGGRLAEVVEKLEATAVLDEAVASYAANDAKRFE